MKRPLRLGVVTDEFFDLQLGRMGGFGWAARQLSVLFGEESPRRVEVVYLASQLNAEGARTEATAHGSRVILRRSTRLANMLAARRERIDLLLTIDYNLSHSVWIRSLPRTPCIVWVRDPRTPADAEKIYTLRIPDAPDEEPQGLHCYDGGSLARIARESVWFGRKLLFATPAPHLAARCEATYGFEPWEMRLLPNAIKLRGTGQPKSRRPTAVFLGRVDPIKRPWLFTALAARFPEVEFLILGQPHFHGPGAWAPRNPPPNVRMLGHVDEDEKRAILSAAWVTVNTSIHEALAVSLIESLACGAPLLSCQDPGFVVSRHGVYTGRFDGDGMQGLDAFSHGLQRLLDAPALREELAGSGGEWVRATHCRPRFFERFDELRRLAGVGE
jgi:glycosyltransferase involved in cell wall biosynthesis